MGGGGGVSQDPGDLRTLFTKSWGLKGTNLESWKQAPQAKNLGFCMHIYASERRKKRILEQNIAERRLAAGHSFKNIIVFLYFSKIIY